MLLECVLTWDPSPSQESALLCMLEWTGYGIQITELHKDVDFGVAMPCWTVNICFGGAVLCPELRCGGSEPAAKLL